MSVEIADEQDVPIDLDRLRFFLEQGLEKAGLSDCEVSVLLTDDDRIAELNRTYRNVPAPTDVLSFHQNDEEGFPEIGNILGDIVISVPTAARQAHEAGIGLDEEVRNLALHGLLHLMGHDHESEGWDVWNRILKEIRPDG